MIFLILVSSGAFAADQTSDEDLHSALSLLALKNNDALKGLQKSKAYGYRGWFDEWWTQRSQFRSPDKSEECHAAAIPFSGFFGSQIFQDLKIIVSHNTPLVRYLDVSTCPYTKTSLNPRDDDSSALAGLRTCLRDNQAGNAIGCLFSPLSTCGADQPALDGQPKLGSSLELSREAALCAKAAPCLSQLKRTVLVSPRLEGVTGAPDVSWLSLKLFARLTAPVPDLQRAVDEEVAKFRKEHPESTGRCVAIHVRRGDKLPECAEGKESSCAFHKSFADYLKPATLFLDQLQGGYFFVMTDDPSLLVEQAKRRDGGYSIVGLSGTTPTNFSHADGLQDLITLLASLELGSACEAVVGNSESEVTELLVLANCAKRSACPSVHSMNGRPLQAFEGVIVDGRASTVRGNLDELQASAGEEAA